MCKIYLIRSWYPEYIKNANFPGNPVIKTHSSTARGLGLIPSRGTKISHAAEHSPSQKELLKLDNKRQHICKIGKGYGLTFFQRRCTNGQLAHEKMLSIINHLVSANQNSEVWCNTHRGSPLIPTRMVIIKKSAITIVGEDMEKLVTL